MLYKFDVENLTISMKQYMAFWVVMG